MSVGGWGGAKTVRRDAATICGGRPGLFFPGRRRRRGEPSTRWLGSIEGQKSQLRQIARSRGPWRPLVSMGWSSQQRIEGSLEE